MPAKRPQATFEPISPDFDVRDLVESADNFQYVDRISYEMIEQQGLDAFEKLVQLHVIIGGKPLVVDGFDDLLDPWTFTPKWLENNHGSKVENARNLTTQNNIALTVGHYLRNMGPLADQFFHKPTNYKEKNRQRMYLKDIDCPPVWHDKLKEQIPAGLFYWNDTTGVIGGVGAQDDGRRKGKGYGKAGDLMSSLPPEMRADNLMCYIGHEGTYTPAHKEMCASLGQNIMVEASGTVGEDGRPERPGSSLWFMTETKDRHLVQEYWLSMLGHDIEVEKHFAQIMAWVAAPFRTYVVEQRPGDFILIPPLAPHQVWNRGTRTMKIAWNRTTVETLEMAMNEALPNARMVCRDEQYKNKAIVYYTLQKYAPLLKNIKALMERNPDRAEDIARNKKVRELQKDFKKLFELYKRILLSEMFSTEPGAPKVHPEFLPFDSNVTCAYCRGNIFNRFLTCKSCPRALGTDVDEPYDICMDCFAMGRSCGCTSDFKWCEQWKFKDLLTLYEEWRNIIIEIDGGLTAKTPQAFAEERRYYGKKSLAQVCQEELRSRPWVDILNPKPREEEDEEAEIVVNDDGTVKKMKKKPSEAYLNKHKTCHVCCHRHEKWKMAKCATCDQWWCYGTLFRAHDLMPQMVMEDLHWKCPHCRGVCNTGRCRIDPRQTPYEPKGTLLGHDTSKVADVRSIEALFSYGKSNLNWINQNGDPRDSSRLLALQTAAEQAKLQDPTADEHFEDEHGIRFSPVHETYTQGPIGDTMIDPALGGSGLDVSRQHTAAAALDVDGEHDVDDTGIEDQNGGSLVYPDPQPNTSNKRKRNENQIKLVTTAPKRRKKSTNTEEAPEPNTTVSGASKQFRQEQEKKVLTEARINNRYIIVWGAMRGKKNIVRLYMDPQKLAEIVQRPSAGLKQTGHGSSAGLVTTNRAPGVILSSDVNKPAPQAGTTPTKGATAKRTTGEKNRIRRDDESDDDFRVGRRRTADGSTITSRRPKGSNIATRTYADPDSGDDEEFTTEYAPQQSSRRAQKEAELVELPDNFKEGTVNKRRNTISRTDGAQIRPQNNNTNRANGKFSRTSLPSKAQLDAQAKAAREAAAQLEADNIRAKMAAAGLADDEPTVISDAETPPDDDDDDDDSSEEETPRAPTTGFTAVNTPARTSEPKTVHFEPEDTPPVERKSIFDRAKKVKIVGAAKKSAVSAAKRRVESEESADEIPAKGAGRGRGPPAKRRV